MPRSKKSMRSWVKWTVAAVWSFTIVTIFVLLSIHPATTINATLRVTEISFRTSSSTIFSPANEEQFIVSRVTNVNLDGTDIRLEEPNHHWTHVNRLDLQGEPSASCMFYNVRISPVQLLGDSLLVLLWPTHSNGSSFALKSHGQLSGRLTAQTNTQSKSGFVCMQMHPQGEQARTFNGEFAAQGSVAFTTATDTQIDFHGRQNPDDIGDTQIVVLNELRFSHIELGPHPMEKTVLLATEPGKKNEISFESVNRKVAVNDADILLIRPDKDFYIRQFHIFRGIQLSLHGKVQEVAIGAGAGDLTSQMPSLFDEWDNRKRVFTVIAAIATLISTLILGFLEKSGILKGPK